MSWNIEPHDGVAVVTMNTNPVNAQSEQFFTDLHEAFDRLEKELPPAAVVLTAEGTTFSAGIDLKQVVPLLASRDDAAFLDWFARYRSINLRVFSFPRPTIAAINGHTFAGGVITALCCDYRIAADGNAKFGTNEVPIGIPMPSVYAEIIRYAIGTANAAAATLFGEVHDVRNAQRLGFVHEIVPPENLLEAAVARGRVVPTDAFAAYAATKRALQAPTLAQIDSFAVTFDNELTRVFADPGNTRVREAKYQQLQRRAVLS
jgi:enoyl-CoA hydratase/carnithine racemase